MSFGMSHEHATSAVTIALGHVYTYVETKANLHVNGQQHHKILNADTHLLVCVNRNSGKCTCEQA